MPIPPERQQKDHELMVKRETQTCRFYRGTAHHETCLADVNFRELVGGPDLGWGTRLPCLGPLFEAKNGDRATCEKRSCWTVEEAEAREREHEQRIEHAMAAMKAARDHAKAQGFKKGRGGEGELPCPICTSGTLRYSVAA